MKVHLQSGKIRFSTLIILAVLFYGGYCAVKIASAEIMKGQIKTACVNGIGEVRGPDLTVERCEEVILDVLDENGILGSEETPANDETKTDTATTEETTPNDNDPTIKVTINGSRSNVHFTISYNYTSNLVFFKYKKSYFIEGDVQNYN